MYAFEQVVGPIVDQFKPELILVSAGQDPSFFDPLARMMVTADGFRRFARFMKELAEKHCDGRLVLCHEGGYSAAYVPFCSLAIVEELSGIKTAVEDPFMDAFGVQVENVYPHEKEAVQRVIDQQSAYWNFSYANVD